MSEVSVQWDDPEETTVRAVIVGRFTWEEFFDAQQQANRLIETKPYRCDLIADLSRGRSANPAPAIQNARQVLKTSPQNLGMFVIITSAFASIVVGAVKRFDPNMADRVEATSRLENARELIARSRELS